MDCGLDFIITDSPLLLTHYYGMKNDWFEQHHNTSKVRLGHHHGYCKVRGYKIDHFFLERTKPYSESGRYQTEIEAKQVDVEVKQMLDVFDIKYDKVACDENCVSTIIELMKEKECITV